VSRRWLRCPDRHLVSIQIPTFKGFKTTWLRSNLRRRSPPSPARSCLARRSRPRPTLRGSPLPSSRRTRGRDRAGRGRFGLVQLDQARNAACRDMDHSGHLHAVFFDGAKIRSKRLHIGTVMDHPAHRGTPDCGRSLERCEVHPFGSRLCAILPFDHHEGATVHMADPLTLKRALESDRLDEFIREQEAAGVGPADKREVMNALEAVIKPRRSKGRTSRSSSRGGSSGK
jgi:hypothetical protein